MIKRVASDKEQQEESVKRNMTSVWYGMNEQLYLMHVKDIKMKIDEVYQDNDHLKKNLELYIRRVEQIEKAIVETAHPQPVIDEKKLAEYTKEINEIDAAIQKEMQIVTEQEDQKIGVIALNDYLFSFVQTQSQIYNEAVVALPPLYSESQIYDSPPEQLPPQLLIKSDEDVDNHNKIVYISGILQNNQSRLTEVRYHQQQKLNQNEQQKKTLISEIKLFYEKQQYILPGLQRNIQENMAIMQQLNGRKQALEQINKDIFTAKASYDRKLASIIELRNIIALKNREKQVKIQRLTQNQSLQQPDQMNQNYEEADHNVNKKIVFQKQQPPYIWRLVLLVWFAVLSLTVNWLHL